jgi:hypothetical protein
MAFFSAETNLNPAVLHVEDMLARFFLDTPVL